LEFSAWARDIGMVIPRDIEDIARLMPEPELRRRISLALNIDPAAVRTDRWWEEVRGAVPREYSKALAAAKYLLWQEGINKLSQESPGKSHEHYCKMIARRDGVPFQTVRRRTRAP